MVDLYLSFPDEATADKVLGKTENGYSFEGAVDVVGVIYKPTGKVIQGEDGEYPETAPTPGWHVNVRGKATKEVKAYAVEVLTPVRVWV